ncbi:uncharacterized protein N7498_010558 [Penicillium cinerascens]|uniref:Uncharacterized protein n=1 Tax=Penicillium cinerascens TaxID=70096 RepID=A0A9W9M7B2_9EURO|nr:uncharacterized protein N7498_010558 [Penicillium cinerascens]KAJ5191573.1 hypothetical protein N7498_010558 [Penicillium cinerascens]
MTESNSIQNMFPRDAGAGPPAPDNHVETQRSIDPRVSLEDYNRTMLEYTQQQMSSFVDLDDERGSGTSGRGSESSGSSGNSGHSDDPAKGVMTSQPSGLPPTSAGAAAAKRRHLHNGGQTSALTASEANSSRY